MNLDVIEEQEHIPLEVASLAAFLLYRLMIQKCLHIKIFKSLMYRAFY